MDLIEVKNRDGGVTARHPWELARFEVINSLLKKIIKNETSFNILDVGCGDIFFITKLSDLYPKAKFYAIDIAFTDEIIRQLKKNKGDRQIFLFKSIEDANEHLKGEAGLVLLLDVVEHIEKDVEFLTSLYSNRAVTANTHVLITVPAFQGLFCSHDHFLGHYRRYTNSTLLGTIKKAGFEKVALGYFFSTLVPARILQVLKEKVNKPNKETTGLVEWNKGPAVTNFVKGILLADFALARTVKKLTGLSLPGLSNYIICKKPAS